MPDRAGSIAVATASFGAAIASIGTADASIVTLTGSPDRTASFSTVVLETSGGANVGSLFVTAFTSTSMFGGYSTPTAGGGSSYIPLTTFTFTSFFAGPGGTNPLDNVQHVGPAPVGTAVPGSVGSDTSASAPGTQYFMFEQAGNVGWFAIHFAAFQADFLGGALETTGSSIRVGQLEEDPSSDVPLPATLPLAALGTLALGAVGLRRRRMTDRPANAPRLQ